MSAEELFVLRAPAREIRAHVLSWLRERMELATDKQLLLTPLPLAHTSSDYWPELPEAIGELTDRGWHVAEIISHPEGDHERFVLDLLRTYRYSKNYTARVERAGVDPMGCTFLVIPNTGALQLLCSESSPMEPDHLLQYGFGRSTDAIEEHVRLRMGRARVLLDVTDQDTAKWEQLTRDVELTIGDRLQCRELFTTLSEPSEVVAAEYKQRGFAEDAVEDLVRLHHQRVDAMHQQLGTCRFMNVAHLETVERYIASGYRERRGVLASPENVRTHVRNEIQLLTDFPNYNLALTEMRPDVAFMIKGSRVLFEVIRKPIPGEPARRAGEMMIQSEALVALFRRHFERLWTGAPRNLRTKEGVVAFLEQSIDESPHLRDHGAA